MFSLGLVTDVNDRNPLGWGLPSPAQFLTVVSSSEAPGLVTSLKTPCPSIYCVDCTI
jgi:hypothetical protein